MQEMVSDFENKLKNNMVLYNFYLQVKSVLVEKYGDSKIDIESMLSVFTGISTRTKPVQLGHFLYYYVSKNCANNEFSTDEINLASDLKLKLHDYIKNKCGAHIEQKMVYDTSYLPFFQHMEGEKRDYGEFELCHDWKAYTTNYDNIFEDFWCAFEPPADHFQKSSKSNKYIFNTTALSANHTFSKLHGSLDWAREVSSGQIVRVRPAAYSPIETKKEIMLFPVQQKDLYLHPWFTLFQDLKMGLSDTQKWYVIGYAFNDEFIRNVFQGLLVDDPSKKLILINPEAEEIKSKFSGNIQNQIDALPMRFGHECFGFQFREYTENIMTIVVRFKTTDSTMKHRIKVESNYNIRSAVILPSESTGWNVFTGFDAMHEDSNSSIYVETEVQKHDAEIKLELQIDYEYNDEIKLRISAATEVPDFTINYGNKTIFRSNSTSKEIIENDSHMSELIRIKLTNTDLYSDNSAA